MLTEQNLSSSQAPPTKAAELKGSGKGKTPEPPAKDDTDADADVEVEVEVEEADSPESEDDPEDNKIILRAPPDDRVTDEALIKVGESPHPKGPSAGAMLDKVKAQLRQGPKFTVALFSLRQRKDMRLLILLQDIPDAQPLAKPEKLQSQFEKTDLGTITKEEWEGLKKT